MLIRKRIYKILIKVCLKKIRYELYSPVGGTMVRHKISNINNIVIDLNEITTVKSAISEVLYDDCFNNLNYMKNKSFNRPLNTTLTLNKVSGNLEFISVNKCSFSPYSTSLSENEFFEIVEASNNKLSRNSGTYQAYLFGLYLQAKKENDEGFISDVFNKAIVFRNNLNYIKKLSENSLFMKEWHKNFGRISPVRLFKKEGSLRKINIINGIMT